MRQATGGDVLRVARWKGDPTIALLTTIPGRPRPLREELARSLERVAAEGYHAVLTGAVEVAEAGVYLDTGFEERARLHVLGRPLDDLPASTGAYEFHRARRRDRAQVHAVDRAGFGEFWQLDAGGIDDAINATPEAHFRVARREAVIAYAICGRAGHQGYVQRLAVHPDHRRAGIGRELVVDGLHWMRRRGARDALVNTQIENDDALALYESLGFRRRGLGLCVLGRSLS